MGRTLESCASLIFDESRLVSPRRPDKYDLVSDVDS